jgi:hypothetical protein
MGDDDALIVLTEFDRASAGTKLFPHSRVPRIDRGDLSSSAMPRLVPGLQGIQHFFATERRAFCLYVVVAARGHKRALVEKVNDILSTVRIHSRA